MQFLRPRRHPSSSIPPPPKLTVSVSIFRQLLSSLLLNLFCLIGEQYIWTLSLYFDWSKFIFSILFSSKFVWYIYFLFLISSPNSFIFNCITTLLFRTKIHFFLNRCKTILYCTCNMFELLRTPLVFLVLVFFLSQRTQLFSMRCFKIFEKK